MIVRISSNTPVKKLRRLFLEKIFQMISASSQMNPDQLKAMRRCQMIKDVPYLESAERYHLLDIILPPQKKETYPILMYIHGGGFTTCSKETHRPVGLANASKGFVVFNVNYRLSPKYRFPSAFEDVCDAYGWIIKNAKAYGGDLSKIVIGGESAGANLALALTVACCYERKEPSAKKVWDTGIVPLIVQLFCGILQVSDPKRLRSRQPDLNFITRSIYQGFLKDVAEAYLGEQNSVSSSENELADPLRVIESDVNPARALPAIFSMVGSEDILWDDTYRLEQALIRQNTPHQVKYYEGEGHVFYFNHVKKATKQFKKDIGDFMRNSLGNQNR